MIRAAAPAALAVIVAASALAFGGYHPRHGGWMVALLAGYACVLLLRGAPLPPRRTAASYALGAAAGLVVWSAASTAWADASRHDAAVETLRALGVACALLVGVLIGSAPRAVERLSVWWAGACAAGGTGIAAWLALGPSPLRRFAAGRLDWPVGYAPGFAALCLMAMLVLVSASLSRDGIQRPSQLHRAVRAAALGGAGVLAALALLAQSRGTAPALVVALLVGLIVHRGHRAQWTLHVAVAIGLPLLAWPVLSAPYQALFDVREAPFVEGSNLDALTLDALDATQRAGWTILALGICCAVAGALLAWGWQQLEQRATVERDGPRGAATGLRIAGTTVLAAALALGAFASRDWATSQYDGCVNPPEANAATAAQASSSYLAGSGTGRCDYYRVAARAGAREPLTGLGAGNFRGEYVRERTTREEPRVVHSLPLQLWAELGALGVVLGSVLVGAIAIASRSAIRGEGGRAYLPAAGAVTMLGYWLAHASIDWLWQLSAVTAPAALVAGALLARDARQRMSSAELRDADAAARAVAPSRVLVTAGIALATVGITMPITLADTALRQARAPHADPASLERGVSAARRAQRLAPTWAEPAITEGGLLARLGRNEEAAAAGRRAVELEPRSWSVQARASGLIGLVDAGAGAAAYQRARALNPQVDATSSEDADKGATATS